MPTIEIERRDSSLECPSGQSVTILGENPVAGTDYVNVTESGNSIAQTFTRTTSVFGIYTRTDTGTGATLPSGSGAIISTLVETANVVGAVFTQSETGSDRYSLLENFNDVSNADNSNSPGNMNYWSFSQPFQDPILDDIVCAIVPPNEFNRNFHPFWIGFADGPPQGVVEPLLLGWGPARFFGAGFADLQRGNVNGAAANTASGMLVLGLHCSFFSGIAIFPILFPPGP